MEFPDRSGLPSCPSRHDLAAFLDGRLATLNERRVADHLTACTNCLGTLVRLAEQQGEPVHQVLASLRETRLSGSAASAVETRLPAPAAAPRKPSTAAANGLPFVLGQYRVVERIGHGGMGAVYRALHQRLKKPVAIKILPAEKTGDRRAIDRFHREMEAIGRLHHPHIVQATDAGESNGLHYLVMELVDGIDLSHLVHVVGTVRIADACEMTRQAALALQYAHEHDLVHRDIKPSNLILSRQGAIKILDLGLALLGAESGGGQLTLSGQVMGTADYMAPEQWAASHAVDIRADIYSLGCTLHTMLVGRAPFAGPEYASATRKMAAHAGETPRPLSHDREGIPSELQALFARLVAKEPEARPATPGEVARALEPFCAGHNLAALAGTAMKVQREMPVTEDETTGKESHNGHRPPVHLLAPPTKPMRRWSRWPAVGVAVAVAALAICLTVWLWPRGAIVPPEPPDPQPRPDVVDAAGWRNLLGERPKMRLWVPAIESQVDHDAKREILRVTTAGPALLRLGEAKMKSYKLQVGFRQMPWVGRAGVYFAGKEKKDAFHFQVLDLRQLEPNDARAFTLNRCTGHIWEKVGFPPRAPLQSFASTVLERPPLNQEHLLELEFRPHGLIRVRWNGEPCADLVTDEANNKVAGDDYLGEFGLYCAGCNVVVTTARILSIE